MIRQLSPPPRPPPRPPTPRPTVDPRPISSLLPLLLPFPTSNFLLSLHSTSSTPLVAAHSPHPLIYASTSSAKLLLICLATKQTQRRKENARPLGLAPPVLILLSLSFSPRVVSRVARVYLILSELSLHYCFSPDRTWSAFPFW